MTVIVNGAGTHSQETAGHPHLLRFSAGNHHCVAWSNAPGHCGWKGLDTHWFTAKDDNRQSSVRFELMG